MSINHRLLTLALLAFSCAPSLTAAPSVRAAFVEHPPRIDGQLDDEAWQHSQIITEFVQREPQQGQPISEKTEVYVVYDRNQIYFGFRCFDSNPAGITAKEMARDISLGEDDRVQVILDTFLDRRNAYWFQIGPRGSIGDALVSDNGAVFNKEWDCLFDGKARIHAQGWDAEIAIPFKSLNFRSGQSRWGMKLIRYVKRKQESSYWPSGNLDTYRFQVSDSGLLEGLEGITQGKGLEISPYGLGGVDQKVSEHTKLVGDAGADISYQITPSLKGAVTLNTDFAQTEADSRQVNLTRFPLFFPEKRDFFLQGSPYFTFGPTGTQLIPFFSRRLGLDPDGNPVPIVWGAKLTGQEGPWNLGFLNIMDDHNGRNHNFTIARVRRNLGSQSSLGLIATHGNAFSEEDNQVVGADFKLASSQFHKNKNIAISLFGLKSATHGLSGRDNAFGGEFVYPNDLINVTLGFHQIEKNFLAGVGFVPRSDIRETYFHGALGPRPHRWRLMQVLIETDFNYITDLQNRLLTRHAGLTPLHLRFDSGDELAFNVSSQREYLDADFQIHPAHVIPAATYDFTRQSLLLQSALRRNFWAAATYRWGAFYDGNRRDVGVSFGYKVRVPLFVGMELERNRVALQDGRFSANVSRLSANILFSPNVTLYNFIQYDNVSRMLGWQSRFRWILKPGNEVLLAWNSKMYDPLERRELTESSARVKLKYNYRF